MKKPLPNLASDQEAEAFVAGSNLTGYDLSGMRLVRFEFQPKSERVNNTRQRCQVAHSTLVMVAFSPSWASETTSLTPRRPRRARLRRNSTQNGSASLWPIAVPSTSRRQSMFTPTATITATETMW